MGYSRIKGAIGSLDKIGGGIIGAVKSIYVSVGHRISLVTKVIRSPAILDFLIPGTLD